MKKSAWIFSFMLDSYLEIDSKENCVTNAERDPNKVHKRITFCKNYEMTPAEEIESNLKDAEIEAEKIEEAAGDQEKVNVESSETVKPSAEVPQTEIETQTDSVNKMEDGPLILEESKPIINFEKKNVAPNDNKSSPVISDSEINTGA